MQNKPFSNTNKNIFLINLESQLDRGALLSRYSRTAVLDIRELFSREFENNNDRGRDFYKRVFLEYGDESVAELVNIQLAIQNISNVAVKLIEESRIGLSYLEKSSRYVRYDRKHEGKFLFMDSDALGIGGSIGRDYDEYCKKLFSFYEKNYEDLLKILRERYPAESIPGTGNDEELLRKSYDSAIRARSLDDLRFVLPASTLTNVGISGNARAFINLIQKLKSSENGEAEAIAEGLYAELDPEYHEIIQSAISRHGSDSIAYRKELNRISQAKIASSAKEKLLGLTSSLNDREAIDLFLTNLFYGNEYLYNEINQHVKSMSDTEKIQVIQEIIDARKNRRDKLPRAAESIKYSIEANLNYGAFRDLQRHRMLTILRKHLTTKFGYDTPSVISLDAGKTAEFNELMHEAHVLFNKISNSDGKIKAQYAVPFAYRHPVMIHGNLRELCYFIELRSTPQAHYDLRNLSIKLYEELRQTQPTMAKLIKFCDTHDYPLGRYSQEYRKEEKLRDFKGNVESKED